MRLFCKIVTIVAGGGRWNESVLSKVNFGPKIGIIQKHFKCSFGASLQFLKSRSPIFSNGRFKNEQERRYCFFFFFFVSTNLYIQDNMCRLAFCVLIPHHFCFVTPRDSSLNTLKYKMLVTRKILDNFPKCNTLSLFSIS